MRTLAEALKGGGGRRRAALVPYVCAGDPSPEATRELVLALEKAGADALELGVPFSDPVADGPVNQRSAERALRAGMTPAGVLELAAGLRRAGCGIPLLAFTYYNPVLRMGPGRFAARAAEAGLQGALVVDLPPEEAGPWRAAASAAGLETVFLAAPTTSDERLRLVGEASSAFVYCVTRLGVTGDAQAPAAGLAEEVARVRRICRRPVAVGFGVATPAQAAEAGRWADGVVVGSALARAAEEGGTARAAELAAAMAAAMEGTC